MEVMQDYLCNPGGHLEGLLYTEILLGVDEEAVEVGTDVWSVVLKHTVTKKVTTSKRITCGNHWRSPRCH